MTNVIGYGIVAIGKVVSKVDYIRNLFTKLYGMSKNYIKYKELNKEKEANMYYKFMKETLEDIDGELHKGERKIIPFKRSD